MVELALALALALATVGIGAEDEESVEHVEVAVERITVGEVKV